MTPTSRRNRCCCPSKRRPRRIRRWAGWSSRAAAGPAHGLEALHHTYDEIGLDQRQVDTKQIRVVVAGQLAKRFARRHVFNSRGDAGDDVPDSAVARRVEWIDREYGRGFRQSIALQDRQTESNKDVRKRFRKGGGESLRWEALTRRTRPSVVTVHTPNRASLPRTKAISSPSGDQSSSRSQPEERAAVSSAP